MRVLLTGGTGFIGSHTAVALTELGHEVVIIDNLINSSADVIDALEKITNKRPSFYKGDCRNSELIYSILTSENIDTVIHFAGLKAVGESVEKPIEYYDNNLISTIKLIEAMQKAKVKKLIFSSSSTVYGNPLKLPLTEESPTQKPTNPYGRTKLQIEEILEDYTVAHQDFTAICLRYFNPIGAHPSGLIGENPNGIPNNLLPYVAKVAKGELPFVRVFGSDYPTKDGTGVRDYIHVMDLAYGHAKAIEFAKSYTGYQPINLGCGRGYSVLEVIKAFEKASGKQIPYKFLDRRSGDIAENWCDPKLAEKLLNWKSVYTLDDMCRDSWNFEIHLRNKKID